MDRSHPRCGACNQPMLLGRDAPFGAGADRCHPCPMCGFLNAGESPGAEFRVLHLLRQPEVARPPYRRPAVQAGRWPEGESLASGGLPPPVSARG